MGDLGLFADRPTPITSIRAPLDIVQDPVLNPGWKPLLLNKPQVSSYKGLIESLDYIASLLNHTHPIVTILVDENIHQKLLKLWYCESPWIRFYRAAEQPSVAQDRTDSAKRGDYETTVRRKDP